MLVLRLLMLLQFITYCLHIVSEAKKVWPDSANISFDPYDQMKFPLPGNSGVVFSTRKNPPLPLPLPTAPIKQENFVLESRTAHETQCDIMTQHVSQAAQVSSPIQELSNQSRGIHISSTCNVSSP